MAQTTTIKKISQDFTKYSKEIPVKTVNGLIQIERDTLILFAAASGKAGTWKSEIKKNTEKNITGTLTVWNENQNSESAKKETSARPWAAADNRGKKEKDRIWSGQGILGKVVTEKYINNTANVMSQHAFREI